MTDGNQEFKRDAGKTRYDLLPWRVLRGLAQVLTFGAKKYEPYSWQKVELPRYIAGGNRHFEAQALDGETVDPESGLLHAWHYLACHMFVAWKMAFRPAEVYAYVRQQDFEVQEPKRRAEYGGEILRVVDPLAPEWPKPRPGEELDRVCAEKYPSAGTAEGQAVFREQLSGHQPPTGLVEVDVVDSLVLPVPGGYSSFAVCQTECCEACNSFLKAGGL